MADRTTTDDRPGIGERYGVAIVSSNLRLSVAGRSDPDLLIAAGWLDNSLGATLFRLAAEWDAVKGEHGIAQAEFERVERAACAIERQPADPGKEHPRDTAARMRRDAATAALTARLMMLIHLKTLREAKQGLWAYAQEHAAKRSLHLSGNALSALVGQVLDIHLDPTCHHCQGRGVNGGYGAPAVLCRACGTTGRRDGVLLRKDQREAEFGAWLLAAMERMLARAGGGIGRALRSDDLADDEDKRAGAAALALRLNELRAPDAGMD